MVKIVGSFEVNDWSHWKSGFDNHALAREKASIKTIYVGNEIDNPNKVPYCNGNSGSRYDAKVYATT